MEFIKNVKDRKVDGRKMGLFKCPYCLRAVKRSLTQGVRQNGCGCVRKWGRKARKGGYCERVCLMCDDKFMSSGVGNRRCPKCESAINQAGHNRYYEPPVHRHAVCSSTREVDNDSN